MVETNVDTAEHDIDLDKFEAEELQNAIMSNDDSAFDLETKAAEAPEVKEEVVETKPDEEEGRTDEEKYSRAYVKLKEERRKLEAERAEIATFKKQKERISRAEKTFEDDPIEFLTGLMGAFYETDDPVKINAGLDQLYNALLLHQLGDGAPSSLKKDKSQVRLERRVKELEEQLSRKAAETERQEIARQHETQLAAAVQTVRESIAAQPELEFLVAEGDDGIRLVWSFLERDEELSLDDALLKANQHLENNYQKKYSRFAKGEAKNENKAAGTKVKQTAKKSLSNADAAPAGTPGNHVYSDDDWQESAKLIKLKS